MWIARLFCKPGQNRDEKAGQVPGIWTVHQPYNGNLRVSSLLRKESPCATMIKHVGSSSHSEKGVSAALANTGMCCAAIWIRQGFLAYKSMRKWRKPNAPDSGNPWKSRFFKEIEKTMKLGIEGDLPASISQYRPINTDNSWFRRVFRTNSHYITSYNSILLHAEMV